MSHVFLQVDIDPAFSCFIATALVDELACAADNKNIVRF